MNNIYIYIALFGKVLAMINIFHRWVEATNQQWWNEVEWLKLSWRIQALTWQMNWLSAKFLCWGLGADPNWQSDCVGDGIIPIVGCMLWRQNLHGPCCHWSEHIESQQQSRTPASIGSRNSMTAVAWVKCVISLPSPLANRFYTSILARSCK